MTGEQKENLDRQWLERLKHRDHAAFAELVRQYHPMVFLCCRTLGLQEHEAEDVASETFMAAYKAMDTFREEAKLSTWLWSIAYRQGVSFLRKRRRMACLSEDFQGPPPPIRERRILLPPSSRTMKPGSSGMPWKNYPASGRWR